MAFYNIATTLWLHTMPNVQVIDPSPRTIEIVVVAGVRAKVNS